MKTDLRRAFTLVELMVTVGLMALLATMASAGYYAAQRGMADRGAMQTVESFAKLAMQRAIVDDMPVVIFLSDVAVSGADSEGLETGVAAGEMTAVRMAGRITYASGGYVVDEFADWNEATFPSFGNNANEQPMRLYRLVANGNANSCISYVSPSVEEVRNKNSENMLFAFNDAGDPLSVGSGAQKRQAVKFQVGGGTLQSYFTPVPRYGFKILSGNSSWYVGDAYGFEIAHVRLPNGYTFGGQVLSGNTYAKDVGSPIFLNPATVNFDRDVINMQAIPVFAIRPGKSSPERIGSVTVK